MLDSAQRALESTTKVVADGATSAASAIADGATSAASAIAGGMKGLFGRKN